MRRFLCYSGRGNRCHHVHCTCLRGHYIDTYNTEQEIKTSNLNTLGDQNLNTSKENPQAHPNNSSRKSQCDYCLLFTFPLQQEVATEAALTLVSHTVVLAVHTHSVFFCGTLRNPGFNLERERCTLIPNLSCDNKKYIIKTKISDTYNVGI